MTDEYVPDPRARELVELHQAAEKYARLALQAQIDRNRAVQAAHAAGGWSYDRIGKLLDLTASRVGQIVKAGQAQNITSS